MSKSCYYLLCILLADLAGMLLSFFYGAIVPAWINSWLPTPLRFLRTAALWLYQRPLLLLPHSGQVVFLHQPGYFWLCCTLLIHLWLLLLYALHRKTPDAVGIPYPGGPYWETVQNHVKSYREAMQRWKPKWALKIPTWRYYKRQDSSQPDMYWHGRILIIERGMFAPDRREELATALARELMHYNSDDIWVKDLLSYYPSGSLALLFLSGLCILFPVQLLLQYAWSAHWAKRTLVADHFTYLLGVGMTLFQQVLIQLRQEDQLPSLRRDVSQDIKEATQKRDALQQRINTHKARLLQKQHEEQQHTRSYYQGATTSLQASQYAQIVPEDETLRQLRQQRNQLNQEITALHERKLQLSTQEQQSFLTRPILEHRLEHLAAHLNNERHWMQQQGIPLPPNAHLIALTTPGTQTPSTQQDLTP